MFEDQAPIQSPLVVSLNTYFDQFFQRGSFGSVRLRALFRYYFFFACFLKRFLYRCFLRTLFSSPMLSWKLFNGACYCFFLRGCFLEAALQVFSSLLLFLAGDFGASSSSRAFLKSFFSLPCSISSSSNIYCPKFEGCVCIIHYGCVNALIYRITLYNDYTKHMPIQGAIFNRVG